MRWILFFLPCGLLDLCWSRPAHKNGQTDENGKISLLEDKKRMMRRESKHVQEVPEFMKVYEEAGQGSFNIEGAGEVLAMTDHFPEELLVAAGANRKAADKSKLQATGASLTELSSVKVNASVDVGKRRRGGGVVVCASNGACIGWVGGQIYCYGNLNSCAENRCTDDNDCRIYDSDYGAKYTQNDSPSCPASDWRSVAPCLGPMACGPGGTCVGWQGAQIYCYGGGGAGCNTNDCSSDMDCTKYTASSPKYTQNDSPACPATDSPRSAAPCEPAHCSVTDGSSVSSAYPCYCGTAICEGDQFLCTKSANSCQATTTTTATTTTVTIWTTTTTTRNVTLQGYDLETGLCGYDGYLFGGDYTFVCDVTMGWYHGMAEHLEGAKSFAGPNCHEYRYVLGSMPLNCTVNDWCEVCYKIPPAVCTLFLERRDDSSLQNLRAGMTSGDIDGEDLALYAVKSDCGDNATVINMTEIAMNPALGSHFATNLDAARSDAGWVSSRPKDESYRENNGTDYAPNNTGLDDPFAVQVTPPPSPPPGPSFSR